MNKKLRDFLSICAAMVEKARKILKKMFDPAMVVGDKARALKRGESDPDDKKLAEVNKTWRAMLRNDPWRQKLMTHVRLLSIAMGIFFLMFWLSGMYLPAKHPISGYICAGVFATLPYWLWVGGWHRRIEEKVFEEFKKRFGKHFHKK